VGAAKQALQQAVKAGAAGLDRVRTPPSGVVILIYHRVGAGSGLEIDLPVSQFDDQMAFLAAHCRAVSLGDALTTLRSAGTDAPARREVVVTFDDGTADFADHVVPVLERHGVPATLFAATGFIDGGRSFPGNGAPLSWAALQDACSTGLVQVGSHTHSHRLLDRLPAREVADELDRSIGLIAERLGQMPLDFAYPKAVPGSADASRAVRERFRSAALAGTRPNRYGATDPYRLARSPVQVSDRHRWFVRKTAGGMAFEDDLRRLLNRRRYAGATT
jgi:peptidoglycan/xylan/chitin deacetylase (PgdA/CDA1 family)